MIRKFITLMVLTAPALSGTGAAAYDFWGINVGTESYDGATQLTFDGVSGSGSQYAVGGWKYTRVDGTWLGEFEAPIPGEGWLASRRSDAQGLFFKPEADAAKFVVIATSAQTGQLATELGYGGRLFGPGDLKIDANGTTYGVGMRLSDLLWAQDPSSAQLHFQLYNADGGILSMTARDAGTLGDIVANPTWGRAGNHTLPANSDNRFAFFVGGTGEHAGSASVSYTDTGISMNGAHVYAYELSVPWEALGLNPANCDFTASWRPDCGNDVISADFSSSVQTATVPEPCTMIALGTGLAGLAAARKRR